MRRKPSGFTVTRVDNKVLCVSKMMQLTWTSDAWVMGKETYTFPALYHLGKTEQLSCFVDNFHWMAHCSITASTFLSWNSFSVAVRNIKPAADAVWTKKEQHTKVWQYKVKNNLLHDEVPFAEFLSLFCTYLWRRDWTKAWFVCSLRCPVNTFTDISPYWSYKKVVEISDFWLATNGKMRKWLILCTISIHLWSCQENTAQTCPANTRRGAGKRG